MPVRYHQFNNNPFIDIDAPFNNRHGYHVARQLAMQQAALYGQVRGLGQGIAEASCCAAVAIRYRGDYIAFNPINGAPLEFGVVDGNSRLVASGLVPNVQVGHTVHAERFALLEANKVGATLYECEPNNAVLFVELSPCSDRQNCQRWLEGGGGSGEANPFNGIINLGGPMTLNVWYRWSNEDRNQKEDWRNFHLQPLVYQFQQINNYW